MIFHPNWHTHHRPTVSSAHKATIQVWRGATGEATWTPEEGLVTPEDDLIYEGLARWQKRGQVTTQDYAADVAKFQRIQISISLERFQDFAGLDERIRVNDRVVLTHNPSNPYSEGSVVYVWGLPTSSNAWELQLICQDNYKQVAGE